MIEGEKLQKVLARAGLGSRRELERWIAAGRVRVNGKQARLGDRVTSDAKVSLDGHLVKLEQPGSQSTKVLIYNKPEGEICSVKDPEGRRTVFGRLPKLKNERWIAVGRLDINTSGLLIFTTDGELANKLMHPSSEIDREYLVRVLGNVTEDMQKRLLDGVELEDGTAQFTDIVLDERSEGANRWFYVCLKEGRNREVRRLWESEGVKVSRLKRVRYGPMFMPSRLKVGQWEYLNQKDTDVLYELVGLRKRKVTIPSKQQKIDQHRQQRRKPRR